MKITKIKNPYVSSKWIPLAEPMALQHQRPSYPAPGAMYVTDPKKAEAGDIRTPKHLADVMVALLDGNAHWVEGVENVRRYAVPSEHAPPGIWRKDVDRSRCVPM